MGEIANSRMRRHLTADEQELLPTGCFSFLLLYPEIRPVSANHQSPITNHQSPITNHQSPFTFHLSPQDPHSQMSSIVPQSADGGSNLSGERKTADGTVWTANRAGRGQSEYQGRRTHRSRPDERLGEIDFSNHPYR